VPMVRLNLRCGRKRLLCSLLVLSAITLLGGLLAADAAKARAADAEAAYEQAPLTDAQEKEFKKQSAKISQILRAQKFATAEEKTAFDTFYPDYFLTRWTLAKNAANIPDLRKDLRNHLRLAKSGEVHDYLNSLTLDSMNKLLAGNYHPAVRVNAMLMIGELNHVEQGGGAPAVPWVDALKVLIGAVGDAKTPDALRAAAMVGILRHAEAGIPDEDARHSLVAAMLKLTAEDAPTGRAAIGHAWIVAQAVETLGLLGSVGDDNTVFQALLKTLSDNKLALGARSAAAEALGQLDYANASGIDAAEAASAVGRFVLDACNDGLQQASSADGTALRRRVLQFLTASLGALEGSGKEGRKGIASLAKDAQQPFLDELRKEVKAAAVQLGDKKHESDDMKPVVEGLRKKVEAWLKKKP